MKKLLKIFSALSLSFLLVNFLCFFYYNPLHGSDLNPYRVEPNTKGVNAVEGFGILNSDCNGFSNENKPLIEKDYILVMGSSQSKADQVFVEDRYSGILNDRFGDEKKLHVYNLAFNGGNFCDIVKNFRELITEFPYADKIIIEIADGQITFDEKDYKFALEQVDFALCVKGKQLTEHDLKSKISLQIKEKLPLILLLYNQLSQVGLRNNNSNITFTSEEELMKGDKENEKEYQLNMDDMYSSMLELIRKQYDGEIIVIYHPEFLLDNANEMIMTKSNVFVAFEKACEDKNITLLDVSKEFQAAYVKNGIIPYGFGNTFPGTGHLNKTGHKILADKLISYLSKEPKYEYIIH